MLLLVIKDLPKGLSSESGSHTIFRHPLLYSNTQSRSHETQIALSGPALHPALWLVRIEFPAISFRTGQGTEAKLE
jgi:hypothetical protein